MLRKKQQNIALNQDKILLSDQEDEASEEQDSDSDNEEAVLDLNKDSDLSQQDSMEDEDDEDQILQEALSRGGKEAEQSKVLNDDILNKITKQYQIVKKGARRMSKVARQYIKLNQKAQEEGEGAPSESEYESDQDQNQKWGKKGAYYGQEDIQSSDEEDLQAQEQEAIRLQREQYRNLNLDDMVIDGAVVDGETQGQQIGNQDIQIEKFSKQYEDSYTKEQIQQKIQQDKPELLALIKDLQNSMVEVQNKTQPLLQEVRQGKLVTKQGFSYLEAKHLLLLSYCIHIVFYLLLRAEGKPTKSHPVIKRLVEIRAYIEKLRPVDQKLRNQIDKLVKAVQVANVANQNDDGQEINPMSLGPNIDNFGINDDIDLQQNQENGVYKAPKVAPTSMEQQLEGKNRKQIRDLERKAQLENQQASRNNMIKALRNEIEDAPEEILDQDQESDKRARIRLRNKILARQNLEEDLMARVPLSKLEKQDLKRLERDANKQNDGLENFGEDADGLIKLAQELDLKQQGVSPEFLRMQTQQQYGQDLNAVNNKKKNQQKGTGDDDIPMPKSLKDQRMQVDVAKARKNVQEQRNLEFQNQQKFNSGFDFGHDFGQDDEINSDIADGLSDEDDFYKEAQQQAKQRKQVRFSDQAQKFKQYAPREDAKTQDHRAISKAIEKNRGLTPHKKRDNKNPRIKQRSRYEKALKRRKGQVQNVRPQEQSYRGEMSGIKKGVAKSRKFK